MKNKEMKIEDNFSDLNIRVNDFSPILVGLAAAHFFDASAESRKLIVELEGMFSKYPEGFAKHFRPALDHYAEGVGMKC